MNDFVKDASPTGASISRSVINKNQIVSAVDIISEGPIFGLSTGANSVYLDGNPAADVSQAAQMLSHGAASFSFTAGSTSVTSTNATLADFTAGSITGSKYLRLVNMRQQAGASSAITTLSSHPEITITAASSFFESWMVKDTTISPENQPHVTLTIGDGLYFLGHIKEVVSATVAKAIPIGNYMTDMYVDKSSGEYTVSISGALKISTISNNNITLVSSTNVQTGTFKCDLSNSEFFANFTSNTTVPSISNYKSFSYQFRQGTLTQSPINDIYGGSGATSIPASHGIAFTYPDSGTSWPSISGADPIERTSSQMNLSASTARQVDEVRVIFSYPALSQASTSTDSKYPGLQAYKIEIAVNKGGGMGSYENYKVDGEYFYHTGEQNNSFYIQETLSLDRFKPFTDFKLKFTKATRDDTGIQSAGDYDDDYSVQLSSTLASTVCIIRERFIYPWTAYAQVSVDAASFNSIPKRSYLCKGRLVYVPSNYQTREETGGVANYRRIASSGAIHASQDQDWDGTFRKQLVYTDNPAWVFYDIINNDRYGLGKWLKSVDIDIYSLYRIARYCDELVPDGKGDIEPRFRANIYLTKATDCYKVLKDMATTFRSILYWSEGNIVPVVDQDKYPVYNFTKGNVIDGEFNYEGTGSKLRSNQVVVTWNNPENAYVPEALLVEDKQNIVKTGKIISENAVAFGATSIGQATRYGRWKLWTAINQSEVISFGTAINAAFIAPGDIVNVQDADRYDIIYSGRVSNTGTPSTTSIPLDRATILNSGSTYKLSVLIESSVPFLAQDSATIGGTAYTRGDIIPGFTTEEAASNIQDSNNVLVQINWAPYTHVETQDVSTSAGTVTSLTVDTAFTVAPNAETIWALQEHVTASNLDSAASKKMYKILSIKEAKKGVYDITAVEHYNEKFNDIDVDFGLPYVETLLTPSQFVPAPTNLSSEIL